MVETGNQRELAALGYAGRGGVAPSTPGSEIGDTNDTNDMGTMVCDVVGAVFDVAPEALLRPSRGRADVARARQVAMYLAHVTCGLSFTCAGALFARDRTTVAHACQVVEDARDDPGFDCRLELVERTVERLVSATRGSVTR